MKHFYLFRTGGETVTLGLLVLDNNFICNILEPPDKNNQRDISCIPADDYVCTKVLKKDTSVSIGDSEYTYEIRNVPERDNVKFHIGNFLKDTLGCQLCGMYAKGDTVMESRKGFYKFIKVTEGDETFLLTIKDVK